MDNLPPFIPGIELNRMFYQQVVRPLLDKHAPGLIYSVGVVGEGSDVIRFDNPESMDHNWGPHLRIFLSEEDFEKKSKELDKMFRNELPVEFMGFPTNFTPESDGYLVQQMQHIEKGPVNHLIQFYTAKTFFQHYLGIDPKKRLTHVDWLTFPQQALIEVSAGELYHDGLKLQKLRDRFSYYPDDVWRYMYTIQWGRLANLETFPGRTGSVGDELGSQIVTNRIVHCLIQMCFLMEKQYMPYPKWFGSTFSRLRPANELTHIFLNTVHATNWQEREEHLGYAYEIILRRHNELKLMKPWNTEMKEFEGRRYKVIYANKIYDQLHEKLPPKFKGLRWPMGA
ncbi:MAG TPA: DUF4037 domain-containing protein, partial [Verrucomicrobiae bacterium]|nr:DUF4037 domain-containing protein [Verrucomicrobiae bacterium]